MYVTIPTKYPFVSIFAILKFSYDNPVGHSNKLTPIVRPFDIHEVDLLRALCKPESELSLTD